MKNENVNLLNSLNKNQYSDFIRNALGLKCFIEGKKLVASGGKTGFENERALAKQYEGGKMTRIYTIRDGDYMCRIFHDDYGSVYDTMTYFDSIGEDSIGALLEGSRIFKQ